MVFSESVLEHFQAPRNVGQMPDADAEAEEENPACGDRLHLWLRIRESRISDASWQAQGCAPAIAAASVTSELIKGMTVDQARALSREQVTDALGGLPARKSHAASLAVAAVRSALARYETGR